MGFTVGLVGELDTVGDWGVLTTDAGLTITGWNHWLERHIGRQAEAFLGRPLFDAFPDLLARKFDRHYRQALGGQTVLLSQRLHKYLLPLPPPVAEERFEFMQQAARIIPLVDAGAVCGTVTVVEDVTERVAYEMELRERVESLRDADHRKDEFLAMLAHELRNPLAPIRNALQLVRMICPVPAAEGSRAYDIIERQVEHLVRLVDDLLDVSRIASGKIKLQKEIVDLATIVSRAVEGARPIIDARRHALEVTLPEYALPVEADPVRLSQVLWNLLNNAAKYTPEGGRIGLTAAKEQGEAVVRVRDTGLGISAEMLPKVFDLFTQMERTLARAEGGLGIGLTLVRRLTEMHGGRVAASSRGPGQGSEFVVRLPIAPGAGSAVNLGASSSADKRAASSSGMRILVVDDNRDSAESLAMLLKLFGNDVRSVYDGRLALEVATAYRPDVVLLDIGLPGLDGLQVCQGLRKLAGIRQPLVIAMTGYGQEEDQRRSQQAGFDAHMVKPVDLETLQDWLSRPELVRREPG
jgi:signal transduction histidine kinase/ActR/RegA family two-component response regulator